MMSKQAREYLDQQSREERWRKQAEHGKGPWAHLNKERKK